MPDIPTYSKPSQEQKVDPVARSMARRDACAKPCSMKGVRVRVNIGKDKSVKIRKRKRNHDPRDVHFY